ncbi:MAG TPA: hypothetical protein VID47_10515 [Actinomycetota bacterium]|jgi:hypothetical protein
MRRHNFDPISFILGALFAAIGLTFLFGNADIADFHLAVVWPLPLIVIGLLMLVTTLQRRSRQEPALAPAPPPATVSAPSPVGSGATDERVDGASDEIDGLDRDAGREDDPLD